MPDLSPFHKIACDWAEDGFRVFPCLANGKRPACTHGHLDATTDRKVIDAWWTENPNYNPAFSPGTAGLGVVDLDPGSVRDNLPDTYEVRTPRLGSHLYYKGTCKSTASKIGGHIDTRSNGGYVLLPGSVVDGKTYELVHDRELAPLPQWVADAATRSHQHVEASDVELDLPGNITSARTLLHDWVRRDSVAISGHGGNNLSFELACKVRDCAISQDKTWELLRDHWNPHCKPPWSETELKTIINNAYSYAQNGEGAYGVAPASEVFAASLDKLPAEMKQEPRSIFYAEDEDEQDTARDPEELVHELIPERATVLWLGKKGSFKSALCGDVALAVAAGVPTFGSKPKRTGTVFYATHEGRNYFKKAYRRAWKIARELDQKIPIYVMRAPVISVPGHCEEFKEAIRARLREPNQQKIALIVLDTVAKCMVGLDENSAKDCGIFIQFCESLRDEFECSVVAQHHVGKDTKLGGRGSSALPAGFETVIESIRAEEGSKLVEVRVRFQKEFEERQAPWHFEAKKLGNSFVMFPAEREKFVEAVQDDDPYSKQRVGAALRKIDAIGADAAVSVTVLARGIILQSEGTSLEEHEEHIKAAERKLRARAQDSLRGYAYGAGSTLRWALPEDAF